MLSARNRLRHNNDFTHVLKKGKRHYFGGVLLYYADNTLDRSRIGFIVSKKHSPSAVKRNYQRRILQHAIHNLLPQIAPGKDIVISYTNHGKVLPYKEACSILLNALDKNNLLIK